MKGITMTGKDIRPEQVAELRRQAEEIASDKASLSPVNFDVMSPEEIRQMLHELQVHQIELEMQNEEMRSMQAEQDAARARYFDLYDLAPVGYCTISEKGLILETNLTAATMLGEDRSMLVKQPITRFILKEDQDDYYLHCQQLFEIQVSWQDSAKTLSGQTGESQACDLRMIKKDGTTFWVHLVATCVQATDSAPVYRIVISDITGRKQAEEESAKLEARLHQTQKMESIGSLAGGIAHDLNNILFPISGLSEMLLRDVPTGSPEHDSIEQIYKSAQRGSDLVKQILAFSRQSNPQKLPIRIQPILKEVLKLVRATIPKNIEVTNHIQPDCSLVSAEPSQVHQIAMNLIINAYHAVEGNGGTIHVALKEIDMSSFDGNDELAVNAMPGDFLVGRYACITVYDTGTGIDQTLINKIFDPYFTTKALGKGTGLGLSVVYGIIKDHGGDIRVYSEIGKGTAFKVYLPILEDTKGRMAAAVIREWPIGYERILLVDDEEPIVRMEQKMLERLGYQITARTSSPDALDVFRADPGNFDLVISDRGMPNMTGEQLARELFAIKPGIPIILCTGFSDENDEQRAKAIGIKGFLMKPVATGDLAEMVRKVLDDP
jgi:PAS domain S-box-containing protein